MKLQGVIFDFNGVIIDDYPLQKEVWNKISLKSRGKEVTNKEMLQKIRGVQTKEIVQWLGNDKISEEDLLIIVKEKEETVRDLYLSSPLFCLNKGLDIFLDDLKKNNIPRTIATSSKFEDMQFALNKLGLTKWFDINLIVYNDGLYKGKPAPDAYVLATKKLNLDPKDCVVFEDAVSGIKAAYAAGVRYIIGIGNDERLAVLKNLPGVMRGIRDFSEIKASDIFP